MVIHLRRISWVLVSQYPDVSLDLDVRLGLIPITASPPQIHPVHLALIMSHLDIVSGMVLSILYVTLVLIEVIKKNKRRMRFETTTTDSKSEVHVDTEVDTVVDFDNEPRLTLKLKLKTKQAAPTKLTPNFQTQVIKWGTQKHFLNFGRSPTNTLRRSTLRNRVTLHP